MKHAMHWRHKRIYSQDLLNLLFPHAYTKIQVVEVELADSRITATTYLDTFANDGCLQKVRRGRLNSNINSAQAGILTGGAE